MAQKLTGARIRRLTELSSGTKSVYLEEAVYADRFSKLRDTNMKALYTEDSLGQTAQMLFFLISRADTDNVVELYPSEMVQILGWHKTAVSRALLNLFRAGIACRCNLHGNGYQVMLNPTCVYRGKETQLNALLALWDELCALPANADVGQTKPVHSLEAEANELKRERRKERRSATKGTLGKVASQQPKSTPPGGELGAIAATPKRKRGRPRKDAVSSCARS